MNRKKYPLLAMVLAIAVACQATPTITTTFSQNNWLYSLSFEWSDLPADVKGFVLVVNDSPIWGTFNVAGIDTFGSLSFVDQPINTVNPGAWETIGEHEVTGRYFMEFEGVQYTEITDGGYTITQPTGSAPGGNQGGGGEGVPDTGSSLLMFGAAAAVMAFVRRK